jgi:hypothetical protein
MGDIGLTFSSTNIPGLSSWLRKNRYNHTGFPVPSATAAQKEN